MLFDILSGSDFFIFCISKLEKVAIIPVMPTNKKVYIAAIAATLWCFAIIAVYYVSHKPFTPDLAVNGLLAVWRLIVGIAITALAGGIGWLIVRDDHLNDLARLALQAAFGLGILALGFLLIGVTIGYPRLLPGILLIVLLAIFRKGVWNWLRQWQAFKRSMAGVGFI
jgi:hypothetical protein